MARGRAFVLAGVALLLVTVAAIAFVDTTALPPEDAQRGCGDWWCASRNSLPVGIAFLSAGIGAVLIGLGTIEPWEQAEPPKSPEPPHEPEPFRRRPL